ncbi:MAG: ATP--corrinoid adenosyltransferase [Synechococcus sp. TMED169]|jgi:cob(I)alamin adenosyltransferase|nr:MAG: ATP--corrinoid adenosyltransferase [Synechococcus sp. TMED169]
MLSRVAERQHRPSTAPLRLLVREPEGLLQIHTASFRGSFASVFSEALRSAGLGSRVLICQFLRGGVDQGPHQPVQMCGRLTWLRPAVASCLQADHTTEDKLAVQELWQETQRQILEEDPDLVVLDELGLALDYGLLEANAVISTLQSRPGRMDVILTGPAVPEPVMAMADQVTELRRDRC